MRQVHVIIASIIVSANMYGAAAIAEPLAVRPKIVETTTAGDKTSTKTLIECAANQAPIATEGPTEEVAGGKLNHYDHGILKCAPLSAKFVGEAGGSGSVSLAKGRKLEVANCPAGTTPFVMALEPTSGRVSLTAADKPLPKAYAVAAPVVVGCLELSLLQPHS